MKKSFVYIILLFCVTVFAQDNEQRSYKFDTYKLQNIKDYKNNIFNESHFFSNSKDSTYVLELRYGKENEALLFINDKNKQLIRFELDFKYSKIEDLNKLISSKLYTNVIRKSNYRKYKDFVEEMKYENDTIDNQIIVHLIQYKNKKKKKTINNHYYFFSNKNIELKNSKSRIIDYLSTKYQLLLAEDLKIDRIMHLEEGKLSKDTYFLKNEKIDFLFNFKINEVNPKSYLTF
ncbi:MAG TPA: hypothetical protein PLH25_08185 [Flavobacterium sp.]|nr:hypothetical protein [Flavobacterium sp.]